MALRLYAKPLCHTPFQFDRVLEGEEVLALQGLPRGQVATQQFSTSECRSLAGEAFFAASMCTVSAAFYLNPFAPWWS